MQYTKYRLTGLNTIDLNLVGASPDDPFIVQNVDGLGPSDVTVTIASPLRGKGIFQAAVPANKQLVFTLGLNPAWSSGQSVSDLREMIYGLLTGGPLGLNVVTQLMNVEDVVAEINGYVSKCEPNPFSKDPQVILTIECDSPYFEADPIVIDPDTLSGDTSVVVTNPGSAPTSVELAVQFNSIGLGDSSPTYFKIGQTDANFLRVDYPFEAHDILTITNSPGDRMVTVTRDGDIISLLGHLTTDENWMPLYPGVNHFTVDFDGTGPGITWLTFNIYPQYQGV